MMGSLLCVLEALIENQGNGAERTRGGVARGREELDRMRSCWPTEGSWVWSAGEIHWSFQKGKWYNPACGFRRFSWLLSKEWVAESKHWIGRAAVAVRDGRSSDRGWGRKDRGEKRVDQEEWWARGEKEGGRERSWGWISGFKPLFEKGGLEQEQTRAGGSG